MMLNKIKVLYILMVVSILILPTSSLSSGSGLADAPWPAAFGDAQRTGLSHYDTSLNDGTLKWKTVIGVDYSDYVMQMGSPVIGSDETIYIGSLDGNLYAIDKGGNTEWKFNAGDKITGSPCISSDGTVYVPTAGQSNHALYAVDENGNEKWHFDAGGPIWSSPVVGDDSTIYFGCTDYKIYALNPNGSLKWSYSTGNYIFGQSPALDGSGNIYIRSNDGFLYSLDREGGLRWRFELGEYSTDVSINGENMYLGVDNELVKLDTEGHVVWRYAVGDDYDVPVHAPSIGPDEPCISPRTTETYTQFPLTAKRNGPSISAFHVKNQLSAGKVPFM